MASDEKMEYVWMQSMDLVVLFTETIRLPYEYEQTSLPFGRVLALQGDLRSRKYQHMLSSAGKT